MPAPVYVDFVARGMNDVGRAFRSVRDSVLQGESASSAAVRKGTSERERAYAKLTRDAARWQRQLVSDAEKAARDEVRAHERAAQQKNRIREASATMAGRFAAQQAAAEIREAERAARTTQRIQERSARERDRRREAFANAVTGASARGFRNAASMTAAGAQRLASTVLGLGGGLSVADVLGDRVSLERKAAQIANQSNLGAGSTRVGTKDVMSTIRSAAVETNTDPNAMAEAMNAYIAKNPDFAGAKKNLGFFGKVAKATGADVKDVASTAGLLGVQNKGLDGKAMEDLILQTVIQSRKGSIEYSDLAKNAGKITRSSAAYAGDQTDTQRRLLGLAEVGMRTTGSPEEAATVLSNISQDASKHSDKVKALLGGSFQDEKGRIAKGPDEFIADLLKASGGDLTKLQGAGFGARSQKMFQALAPVFNDAEKQALASGASKKDAREAGRSAVMKDIQDVTGGKYSKQDLEADFANVMKTSAEQFEGAVRQLKDAVADKLLPELVKLIPVLQQGVPALSTFLSKMVELAAWAQENPIKAAIGLLGASITKEVMGQIIAARIGETMKAMLLGGGGGAPGVPGGGVPGVPAAGLAPGTGGALMTGLAMQGLGAYKLYADYKDQSAFGADQGNALARASVFGNDDERAKAQSNVDRMRGVASEGAAAMWTDRASKAMALINPATAITTFASDKITEGLGYTSQGQRSAETQIAASGAEAYEKGVAELRRDNAQVIGVLRTIAANTAAGGGGGGGVNQTARTQNMVDRTK